MPQPLPSPTAGETAADAAAPTNVALPPDRPADASPSVVPTPNVDAAYEATLEAHSTVSSSRYRGLSVHAFANEQLSFVAAIAHVQVSRILTDTYGHGQRVAPTREPNLDFWWNGSQNTRYRIVELEILRYFRRPEIQDAIKDAYAVAIPISTVSDEALGVTVAPDVAVGDEAIAYFWYIDGVMPVTANTVVYEARRASTAERGVHPMSLSRWFALWEGRAVLYSFPREAYAINTLVNILEVALGTATPRPGATPFGR